MDLQDFSLSVTVVHTYVWMSIMFMYGNRRVHAFFIETKIMNVEWHLFTYDFGFPVLEMLVSNYPH